MSALRQAVIAADPILVSALVQSALPAERKAALENCLAMLPSLNHSPSDLASPRRAAAMQMLPSLLAKQKRLDPKIFQAAHSLKLREEALEVLCRHSLLQRDKKGNGIVFMLSQSAFPDLLRCVLRQGADPNERGEVELTRSASVSVSALEALWRPEGSFMEKFSDPPAYAAMSFQSRLLWEMTAALVQAGADTSLPSLSGEPLWQWIEKTAKERGVWSGMAQHAPGLQRWLELKALQEAVASPSPVVIKPRL